MNEMINETIPGSPPIAIPFAGTRNYLNVAVRWVRMRSMAEPIAIIAAVMMIILLTPAYTGFAFEEGVDEASAQPLPERVAPAAEPPMWMLWLGFVGLLLLIIVLLIYFFLPQRSEVELIPQPEQILTETGAPKQKSEEEAPAPVSEQALDQLRRYIAKELARGSPIDAIHAYLHSVGWNERLINDELHRAAERYANMANV